MVEEIDFETYLYVSNVKFEIFLYDKKNRKNLFEDKIVLNEDFDFIDFTVLSIFLDKNIYKIEKVIGSFVKNIFLIVEYKDKLTIKVGKKKILEKITTRNNLENIIIEMKSLVNESYHDQKIIHILLNYSLKNENDPIYLEMNFLTISNKLTYSFDKILQKYQIKITKYFDGNYIKNFFHDDNMELSRAANKLGNGYNVNEVLLIPKSVKNKRFFERFFNFFN
jgi:Rps23 Pro-64 3,4-dihydroxylase Tpa1-like proline 4-hydroxylase